MDALIAHLRCGYPHALPIEWRVTSASADVRTVLERELTAAEYSSGMGVADYLRTCDTHIRAASPGAVIHVVCPIDDVPPKVLLERVLRRIACLCRTWSCSKHLEFWLLPMRKPRRMPPGPTPIQTHHINGGFTYPMRNQIFIVRAEEFPKVMLHETIHHLSLDTHRYWTPALEQALYRLFRIETAGCPEACHTNLSPNEAVVETWAEVFQIAFQTIERGAPWRMLYDMELAWARTQSHKVLTKQARLGGAWREGSHAYSYILLRTLALAHLDAFLATSPKDMPARLLEWARHPDDTLASTTPTHRRHLRPTLRMTLWGDM
jgi:hypothetical protein